VPFVALFLLQSSYPRPLASYERVLLLTAHPDDECFFFGPTLLAFHEQGTPVYSLCISNGNYDGMGVEREQELQDSLSVLGIPSEMSFLINHPQLQDNFTQSWDAQLVAEVVLPYILKHGITILLTFDEHGVSSHPNHVSLYYAAREVLRSNGGRDSRLRAYALRTENRIVKYSGWLTAFSKFQPASFLDSRDLPASPKRQSPNGLTGSRYISNVQGYLQTVKAMNQHRSQMLWFRWLYMAFARYMWLNDWDEIERPTVF